MLKLVKMRTAVGADQRRLMIGEHAPEELRACSKQRTLWCTNCGSPVVYRHRHVRQPHFAHLGSLCIDRYGEPDGPEHQSMKRVVRDWLRERYPEASVETEFTIETGQRTDVLMTLPTGQRIAVEVQYSRLSGADWLERHHLYRQAGVLDVWVQHASRYNELMEWTLWDAHYLPLRQLGGFRARVRINDLATTLVEQGQPLVYLTTETEDTLAGQVRWLVEPRTRSRTELDAITLQTPLPACAIGDQGLVWPALVEAQRHYRGLVDRDTECPNRAAAQPVEPAPEVHPTRWAAEAEVMQRLRAHQDQVAVWQAELISAEVELDLGRFW